MQVKIKNRGQLLKNLSISSKKKRELVSAIIEDVLNKIQPKNLIQGQLKKKSLKRFEKIVIFAIGKAGQQMADAAVCSLKRKPDKVLIADRGHPFPTKEGVIKTRKMMKAAESLTDKDLAIVLISGGGSAMFICPEEGISLGDEIKVTSQLLKSGAPIQEINIVRKQLSKVKGGKFAKLLFPATVWGFAISDVIGNDAGVIASGPISPDKSTKEEALEILKKYRIKIPSITAFLRNSQKIKQREDLSRDSNYFRKVKFKIIADHFVALKLAQKSADKLGLNVEPVKNLLKGEARFVAKTFVQKFKSGKIKIASGETTVTIKGKGFGGRNQEFVLSGLRYLKDGQVLASVGTDGIDGIGPEIIAGAIADNDVLFNAKQKKLKPELFLNNNDSYSFFKQTDGLIKTGPTGTNLGDLMILY